MNYKKQKNTTKKCIVCWRFKMDDKLIMTNLMDTSKGVCALINNAALESDNSAINEAYN